ncbi:MAG: STN domain-containing protein, partial [Bacteroidota bacterium]
MGTSSGRVAQALKILYFYSLLLAPILVLGQKSILQQPVSISVTDKSIAAVLDKLSDNCGVRFTYNPDDISADKRISLQVKDMPLSSILSKVLEKNSFSFHERGGQIIIFRDHSYKETLPSNSSLRQQKAAEVPKLSALQKIPDKEKNVGQHSLEVISTAIENHKQDTLYITKHDTIKIVDTLLRTDTLVLRDTIFINKDNQLRREQYGTMKHGFF